MPQCSQFLTLRVRQRSDPRSHLLASSHGALADLPGHPRAQPPSPTPSPGSDLRVGSSAGPYVGWRLAHPDSGTGATAGGAPMDAFAAPTLAFATVAEALLFQPPSGNLKMRGSGSLPRAPVVIGR